MKNSQQVSAIRDINISKLNQSILAIGNDYHVYIEDGDAYDCMLNQVKYLKNA